MVSRSDQKYIEDRHEKRIQREFERELREQRSEHARKNRCYKAKILDLKIQIKEYEKELDALSPGSVKHIKKRLKQRDKHDRVLEIDGYADPQMKVIEVK